MLWRRPESSRLRSVCEAGATACEAPRLPPKDVMQHDRDQSRERIDSVIEAPPSPLPAGQAGGQPVSQTSSLPGGKGSQAAWDSRLEPTLALVPALALPLSEWLSLLAHTLSGTRHLSRRFVKPKIVINQDNPVRARTSSHRVARARPKIWAEMELSFVSCRMRPSP